MAFSIYEKRKKKNLAADAGETDRLSFADKHRQLIIGVLAVIIVLGAIAAVNAVENHRQAQIEAVDGISDETVTYYYTNGSSPGTASQNEGYPDFSADEISWNGKNYKRVSYIKPILCLGIDRQGDMQTAQEYGYAGQCDAVFLIAQDTARNTVKILMIPRDTMTEVMEQNPATGVIEPYIDHLSLSFCFGDGMHTSCENSRLAVSTLLMNLPIADYIAVDTTVIAEVNDAVGGVTVTVPTEGMEASDPAFIYGETITLHGAQAEHFVRYRDTSIDNSAIARMSQHRQYIEGFFRAVRQQSRQDSQTVVKLFDMVQEYMVTNMYKESYMKAALDVLQNGDINDSNLLTLPGFGTATDTFDEYYANRDSIPEIILSLFYQEV